MTRNWRNNTETPSTLTELLATFRSLQNRFDPAGDSGGALTLAFRGMGNAQHDLTPSLQRKLPFVAHDAAALHAEKRLVEDFRNYAARFLGQLERTYLFAKNPLEWSDGTIWGALAVARHYGVPTRFLDWSCNISVAAFFAACDDPDVDGAIWWFSQSQFESALGCRWDAWNVPKKSGAGERAIEQRAFDADATPWISKVHHRVPFARLEKQAGFFTACGRLDMVHNTAIDELADGKIQRGIVRVRSALKQPLLDYLESIGFRASTIDYPGADVVGARLAAASLPVTS
jgi:hypothetical protein